MTTLYRIRSWLPAAAAAVLLTTTAAPAASAVPPDDTADRLETARTVLASSAASLSDEQIARLSDTLTEALESSQTAFETSALRLLIAYGGEVSFDRALTFDVVRLYRNHDDDAVRRMAVVALGEMNDSWGIDFLRRSLRFEQSIPVKHTVASVVARYQQNGG